ncbi:MAG: FAD-dependent oxidoreductase, partial [Spirochaetales bacterium]|nr:FAD-dependent oxidoreductase [Spirochaetales bacterium]
GSPEKRLTFLKETIEAVKKTAGGDFPLTLRLGANDLLEGGCSPSDAVETACRLEEAGADGISLTGGWHESPVPQLTMDVPAGILSHFARRMKENLGIPLILSNRLNPRLAEELLDSGAADFAGFGRALLADPDMVKKASAGDHKQIRPCIGCNQGCMDRIFFGKTIRCLVNPEAGRESEEIFRTAGGRAGSAASTAPASAGRGKSGSPLSLLIIGGGPAGLNYALGASRKGHSAVVWEKEAEPGGQILLAAGVEERRDFSRYIQWLQNACGEKKIPILTNRPAKAEAVIKAFDSGTFDRVVLATGSAPPATIPEKAQLESDGSVPVMHGWDVLKGLPAPGRKILITGDGGTALWTALKLASRSRLSADHYRFLSLYSMEDEKELKESLNSMQGAITILAPGGKFGSEMGKSSKWVYLSTLKDLGVKILKSSKAESVRKGRVSVRSGNGEPLELEADLLVDTLSLAPASPELHNELSHRGIPVSRIGEARGSCNLYTTVRSAYEEGVTI